MSPSRGYRRDGAGNTSQGAGYGFGYGYGNGNGNGNGYSNANVNAYGFANAYGNGYGYGYTNGNGYSEYEQQQYQQEQQQYQPEQYQPPEHYQVQQYQQQYPQQQYQPYQQYQDGSYDMYNATQYQEPIQQRRTSPSYDAYDTQAGGSAARRQPAQSRGYSTYSSSSSSSSRRPPPPQRPQTPSEPVLMPPSSAFKDLLGTRAGSRSPHRPDSNTSPSSGASKRSSPPPPPRRTEPTEEYLRSSLEPSWHVDTPESARKLIVLDLNGSLLLRSAHQRRAPLPRYGNQHRASGSQPQSQGGSGTTSADPYADPTSLRPVRAVHPRPYLASFVSYILHPTTRKWLDTMVWSSAQPHSVDDMVERCFKERREELRAVWARDTLGLTNDEYHKKSLTLKDLEKPWAELPIVPSQTSTNPDSPIPPSSPSSTSPLASPTLADAVLTSPSDPTPTPTSPSAPPASSPKPQSMSLSHHSARTTLLIDDSPLKAALQPWNHLVIREYVQEMRNKDLEVAGIEGDKERKRESKAKDVKQDLSSGGDEGEVKDASTSANIGEGEGKGENQDVTGVESDAGSTETKPTSTASASSSTSKSTEIETETTTPAETNAEDAQSHRTLKRLKKKEAGKLKRAQENLAQGESENGIARGTSRESEGRVYDQTLLAVIGILDRVRWEGNVAGWMQSGGLVNVKGEKGVSVDEGVIVDGNEADETVNEEPETKNETGGETKGEKKGKTALAHTPPTRSRDASPLPGPPSTMASGADAASSSPTNLSSKKRRRVSEEKAEDGSRAVMDTSADAGSKVGVDGARAEQGSMDTTADAVNPVQALEKEKEEQAATGVPTASDPVRVTSESAESAYNETPTPKLWYEHPDILAFWAAHGRKALAELGIEVQSGLGRTREA